MDPNALVLAGAGHVHAVLIGLWLRHPRCRPDGPITLVSRRADLLYSGLVPAVLAGLVAPRDARLDLRAGCRRAGIRWVQADITGLHPAAACLALADGTALPYRYLSLDVGSVTAVVQPMEQPLRPLEETLPWLLARAPRQLRVRGGGASAVELALALRARGFSPALVLRGQRLQLGSPAAERAAERLLAAAGIAVERGAAAAAPAQLACTGNRAPAWLAAAGLPVEAATGRVLTDATLRVRGWPAVFAAGDCAVVQQAPRPPAGVWAVRAAPVLATNLRRSLAGSRRPLRRWRPPRQALQLLGDGGAVTGRPRALALWGAGCLGPWRLLWWFKLWLDRRFVRRLRRLQARRTRPRSSRVSAL